MRGGRNQAHITLSITARDVIATDGCQTGVLALGTCIGLQGDSVIAGELGQPDLEVTDEAQATGLVLDRGEGVHL